MSEGLINNLGGEDLEECIVDAETDNKCVLIKCDGKVREEFFMEVEFFNRK